MSAARDCLSVVKRRRTYVVAACRSARVLHLMYFLSASVLFVSPPSVRRVPRVCRRPCLSLSVRVCRVTKRK